MLESIIVIHKMELELMDIVKSANKIVEQIPEDFQKLKGKICIYSIRSFVFV